MKVGEILSFYGYCELDNEISNMRREQGVWGNWTQIFRNLWRSEL